MESIMNFMTRSGLNQQMQGEYRVLLFVPVTPKGTLPGVIQGLCWVGAGKGFFRVWTSWLEIFSGKKILACILLGSYNFTRDFWGFQKIRKDFWYKINEEKSLASGKVEIFWRKMYP